MADTQQPALQDRDRAGQAGQFGETGQVTDRLGDGGSGLTGHTQHHNARVTARRTGADVTQPDIQEDQDPASPGSGRNDILIRSASETFAGTVPASVPALARMPAAEAGRFPPGLNFTATAKSEAIPPAPMPPHTPPPHRHPRR